MAFGIKAHLVLLTRLRTTENRRRTLGAAIQVHHMDVRVVRGLRLRILRQRRRSGHEANASVPTISFVVMNASRGGQFAQCRKSDTKFASFELCSRHGGGHHANRHDGDGYLAADADILVEAFKSALKKLALDRTNPEALIVAKRMIRFAKAGERNPARLCDLL
jgi:hypothetical protein